jgi:hypothetical protein
MFHLAVNGPWIEFGRPFSRPEDVNPNTLPPKPDYDAAGAAARGRTRT